MKRKFNKGFTLAEIMVAIAIASIVILSVSELVSVNIAGWVQGDREIKLQQEVQKVMKSIYMEFKSINGRLTMDDKFHIFFHGEDSKNLRLNFIDLWDLNNSLEDGYEKIQMIHYPLDKIGEQRVIRFYPEGNNLIHESNNRKKVVSDSLEYIHFVRNPYDANEIRVNASVLIPKKKHSDKRERREEFSFFLRLSNNYAVVRKK